MKILCESQIDPAAGEDVTVLVLLKREGNEFQVGGSIALRSEEEILSAQKHLTAVLKKIQETKNSVRSGGFVHAPYPQDLRRDATKRRGPATPLS